MLVLASYTTKGPIGGGGGGGGMEDVNKECIISTSKRSLATDSE
jgi:hypothetical protein